MAQAPTTGSKNMNRSQEMLSISLVFFVILTIAFLMPIQPNDFWWYMRIAAETSKHMSIPTTEILSFSQSGQPAVYQHWLAGMVFWLAYRLGSVTMIGLVRGLSIGFFLLSLWQILRMQGTGRTTSMVILLLAGLASSNNWAVRPQILAYPLFGAAVWLIYRWQNRENKHLLWALPLLTLVWANLHSSFILMFVLICTAIIFGKGNKKTLLLALAASVIASFLSPYGITAWTNALSLSTNTSIGLFASEWQPPINKGWQQNIFFLWLIAFPVLAGVSRTKLAPLEWVWFLGFGWMALTGLRYGVWFIFILAALTASLISGLPAYRIQHKLEYAPLNWILAVIMLTGSLFFLPGVRQTWWKQSPPNLAANTPVAATDWLSQQTGFPGKIWADLAYSSYLTYALPEKPVWIYTRMEQFPASQWEEYKTISDGKPGWDAILARDGIRIILASKTDQAGLIRTLQTIKNWQLIYENDFSAVYYLQ